MAGKGRFLIYTTAKGFFNYSLEASNKETIAVSGGSGYTTMQACKAGIQSVINNINAPIEDQTLIKSVELKNPKFEIYMDKASKFRYRLKARNGEIIAVAEDGYASKDSCKKGIASLGKWAVSSEIEIEVEKKPEAKKIKK